MSDTNDDDNKQPVIGATITYDSPHALAAAKAYKKQIAGQLGHKLKNRPYTAAEQKRNVIGTDLLDSVLGKASLPQSYSSGGVKTDPYLKKSGGNYSGWHRASPVNMSGALDNDAWVKGAYKSLLGRDADQAGLDYWKADLAGGSSREDVIANIKKGSEYKDKFISEAYKNLLGRDSDAGGNDYWSKAMLAGESEDSIIANIMRSEEYGRKQQNEMRSLIDPKSASQLMNETYNDKIASLSRDWQDANDAVQGLYGTEQDYSPLLTTSDTIYTQDPEASPLSSVGYLASVDPKDSSPDIWTKALGDAGKKALAGVDISSLVDSFVNSFT